ncbi:choice-of-anchor M domain-containing protein [Patulibacter sp. S7RM1-6]
MSGAARRGLRRPGALLALLLALVVGGPLGGPTAAPVAGAQEVEQRKEVARDEPTATGRKVIGVGHVDIGPRFVDGRWTIQARDDSADPSVWRSLDDLVLQARSGARVTVPDDPSYRFLGTPGARVWLLPQVQQSGVVWPGWNTQDPRVAEGVRREVTWRLHGVRAPDAAAARGFALFLNDEFGAPEVVFTGTKPFPQETGVDADTHVHGNWVFPKAGVYGLDIEMAAVMQDGTRVSDRRLLRFAVGDARPEDAFALAAATDDAAEGGRMSVAVWILLAAVVLAIGVAVGTVLTHRRRRA